MSTQEGNVLQELFPEVSKQAFQEAAAAVLLPITLLRDFGFLSFTSLLGVIAVSAACLTVIVDGLMHQGAEDSTIQSLLALPLWPGSVAAYFQSWGSVVFLFCVNFLIFPIEANLEKKGEWPVVVQRAVTATALGNMIFAALGYSFFGDQTQEIVTNNLGPGDILSAVRILLCIDLLFTYPLIFAAGRDVVENAIIGADIENAMIGAGGQKGQGSQGVLEQGVLEQGVLEQGVLELLKGTSVLASFALAAPLRQARTCVCVCVCLSLSLSLSLSVCVCVYMTVCMYYTYVCVC